VRETTSRETIGAMRYALLLLAACGPRHLDPGEVECTSTPIFGTVQTHCRTGQAPPPVYSQPYYPPVVQPAERRVVEGGKPLYCSILSGDTAIGGCYFESDDCDALFIETKPEVGALPCAATTGGACFMYTVLVSGTRRYACAPSIRNCDERMRQYAGNPDYKVLGSQCDVYRAKASLFEKRK
jgi:hypothetical protein